VKPPTRWRTVAAGFLRSVRTASRRSLGRAAEGTVLDLFEAKALAVGAEVRRAAGPREALSTILELLAREPLADAPGQRAVWCEGPILREVLDRAALTRRFAGLSFEVTRERAAESRVGCSEFDWGLAETGTLAQDATDPRLRLVSTLPELHVALVRAAAILPDLECLLTRIDPRRMKYLACVTGPSRTADIERVLTIGVHGPRRLVIVTVGAPAEARA
jgi:L-lactate dehydrogenase complex protein LldG